MKTYVIYNVADGSISLTVTTKNIEDVNVNVREGQAYIESDYDFDTLNFKVEDGALVSKMP
jgi:uncharacterized beta-barrel protein YwiB (DUF1934 family)